MLRTIHDDREYIGADFMHLHIDFRFPVSGVWPEGREHAIPLEQALNERIPLERWLSARTRPYRGPFPEYPYERTH